MSNKTFVIDTHALLWFLTDDQRLSNQAKNLLIQAENFLVEILIPTITLAELLYMREREGSNQVRCNSSEDSAIR